MARPLGLGLFLFYLSSAINTKASDYLSYSVYLWSFTTPLTVFVVTGFGLSTLTADTTESARFSLTNFKCLLLFSQTAARRPRKLNTTPRFPSERRGDFFSPARQLSTCKNPRIHHHLAFPHPGLLLQFLQQFLPAQIQIIIRLLATQIFLNHNLLCRGQYQAQVTTLLSIRHRRQSYNTRQAPEMKTQTVVL